jgi:NAD(P)-dependent dehydrogenase (short-subunit alcohol dehydrogenase family)
VLEQAGRLDAVVNNAAYGLAGAVEDTSVAEAQAQFDTNFFGVHRVCRAVLPHFRAQGHGRIVIVGSLAGKVALPFQGLYCASKFALEGYAEALRMEVRPFGVQVCLVEPGDYATSFTANRRRSMASGSPYGDMLERALAITIRDEQANKDLSPLARTVLRALDLPRPPLRLPTANLAQRLLMVLRPFVPDAWVEWVVEKLYELR